VKVYAQLDPGAWQYLGLIDEAVQSTTINSITGGVAADPQLKLKFVCT